jgi:hypothetical protein
MLDKPANFKQFKMFFIQVLCLLNLFCFEKIKENDSENEFGKSTVYRSKSADRFMFEKMNNSNMATSSTANHASSMTCSLSRE